MITASTRFQEEKNKICDSGGILEDLTRSFFIVLAKKPVTNECELHQTIILIDHIINFIM